eukprot:TRINITY_DN23659_c0_g1_i5.p1 TRINITY_DN23659_c0_g1~~TRINITY_DN23659_c0_g1_i5.p1  ORF type:complete len:208 (+),score=26.32 TRINITY_DN23659_c0_g1_i5:126-749(+)
MLTQAEVIRRLMVDYEAEGPEDPFPWLVGWVDKAESEERRRWAEVQGSDGRPFWYCSENGEKSWVRPLGVKGSDWVVHHTEGGRPYWHNTRNDKRSWQDPAAPKWVRHPTHDGSFFWYNTATRERTWDPPPEAVTPPPTPSHDGPQWVQYTHRNQTWWYNKATGEKRWDTPGDERQQSLCVNEDVSNNYAVLWVGVVVAVMGVLTWD